MCRGTVDALVVEVRTGDGAHPGHRGGVDGVVQVDPTQPQPGWEGMALSSAVCGDGESSISATGRGSLLKDTCFTRAEVQGLEPGVVVFSVWDRATEASEGNEEASSSGFATVACTSRDRCGS